jgi:hypothetical protein
MRKDMDKLLVTTPRIGSGNNNGEVRENRRRVRDGQFSCLPSYSSMKPKSRHFYDRKELNEYLNPLIRYLAKNCGRPWDKVYSEICKNMDRRGTVQNHIFQHLFDYVDLNPVFRDGRPYNAIYDPLTPLYKNGWTFYVDQKGTLREPKQRPPNPYDRKERPDILKTDDDSVLYLKREDGTWFMVSLEEGISDHRLRSLRWVADLLGESIFYEKRIVLRTLSRKEKLSVGLR